MIEKVIHIKNVGKFVNYCAQGDMFFRQITLVYAENARGKTTLTSLLRSLHTGEARLIHERRTVGCTNAPSVQLRVAGSTITFGANGWTSTCPSMAIFDAAFVTQNIYSGDDIRHEHRRNLHRFALGEDAVRLATRLDEIAEEIRTKNSEISEVSGQIQRHIQGTVSVDNFAALQPVEGVDDLIALKERELEDLKRTDEIQRKPALSHVSLPEVPLAGLSLVLAKGLPSVAVDAERRVKEHLSSCVGAGGEAWLERGVQHIRDDRCPFCGQDIGGLALIDAYKGYFSQSYNNLKREIGDFASGIGTLLSDQALLRVQQALNTNQSLAEYWARHMAAELPKVDFETINHALANVRHACQRLLDAKAAAPLERAAVDGAFEQARQEYENSRQLLVEYCVGVDRVNALIGEKKRSLQGGSVSAAEVDLSRLKNAKMRHTDDVAAICSKLVRLRQEKGQLEQERNAKRQELNGQTTQLLQQYQTRINQYLGRFGADFQISGATVQHYGGAPRIQYNLAIRGQDVQLDDDEGSSSPTFRNTLSSGDRTTLAMAFFLARLDGDGQIGQKTIVLDDPLSSLDGHRKAQTRQEILRLVGQAQQTIVLSHDPYFLRMLWDGVTNKNTVKPLAITRSGTDSTLVQWDVDQDTRGEYFSCYSALIEYRERGPSGDLRDVARCIRPLLEGNLRVRFPRQFGPNYSFGDMILTIQQASAGSALEPMKSCLADLQDINDYTKRYHHAENPGASSETIYDSELTAHVDRALKVLAGVFAVATT